MGRQVDFGQVAKECGIVTKGAAAKRYERMMRAHGIAANAAAIKPSTSTSSPSSSSPNTSSSQFSNRTKSEKDPSQRPSNTKDTSTSASLIAIAAAKKRKMAEFDGENASDAAAEDDDEEAFLQRPSRERYGGVVKREEDGVRVQKEVKSEEGVALLQGGGMGQGGGLMSLSTAETLMQFYDPQPTSTASSSSSPIMHISNPVNNYITKISPLSSPSANTHNFTNSGTVDFDFTNPITEYSANSSMGYASPTLTHPHMVHNSSVFNQLLSYDLGSAYGGLSYPSFGGAGAGSTSFGAGTSSSSVGMHSTGASGANARFEGQGASSSWSGSIGPGGIGGAMGAGIGGGMQQYQKFSGYENESTGAGTGTGCPESPLVVE
ncbi:hypothetical protein G7Y89_g8586 [Cudoniella acicularis]|uniref:Myb-like DNA-binding domain-containing protein n=1 Tax=Cudoniella acicularis TaxID=354080 RepID=A0A8H4RH79_9HELO|nr:hypothetical protein G7Y89_g8586 [Cudoniella acicularis]